MENKYKVRTVLQAIAEDLQSDKITMRQAREKLYLCGWFNYLPSEAQVDKAVADHMYKH